MGDDSEYRQAELRRIREALPQQRHDYRDDRTSFSAQVDGRGELQQLHIPNEALHRAHPKTVGEDLLAAIRGARQAAASAVQEQLDEVGTAGQQSTVGGNTSPRTATGTQSRARPRSRAPVDDEPEELFTGLWGNANR